MTASRKPRPLPGERSERAPAQGPDNQSSLPVALSLPELSTTPQSPHWPRRSPWIPSAMPAHTRTIRSTWPATVTLSCTGHPCFPRIFPEQPERSNSRAHLQVRLSPPQVAVASSPWSPMQLLRTGITIPTQLCLQPGPQLSGKSLNPKPEAQLELATRGTDAAPPSTSSELDDCVSTSPHPQIPQQATPGATQVLGLRRTDNQRLLWGQHQPGKVTAQPVGYWALEVCPRSLSCTRAPSTHHIPSPWGLEVPGPMRVHRPGHSQGCLPWMVQTTD